MTDYRVASALLVDHISAVQVEGAAPEGCFGRILGRDITAGENVPGFDRSPYDGYAFRAADTDSASGEHPVSLSVIEDIRAGQLPEKRVVSGTAVRLMTGAPIPEGADAVCKYEDTTFTGDTVTLKQSFRPGENIVRAGEDIRQGSVVLKRGDRIDEGALGTIASLGLLQVPVYRRPTAGILSTGDEVTEPGEALAPGKIRNSNRYTLRGALERIGFETVYLGHARDTVRELTEHIRLSEKACDILISTGGVSAGDYDLVPQAMQECGYELLVQGIDMKPGMACAYGIRNGRMLLALSGNPASSLTNLQCVCYPALRKLSGSAVYEHRLLRMKLGTGIPKTGGRAVRFVRGRMEAREGELVFEAPAAQGNAVISSAAGCNAYGILAGGHGPMDKGTWIEGFAL